MHPLAAQAPWLTATLALLCLVRPFAVADEPAAPASHHEATPAITALDALQRLKDGNRRFVTGQLQHPHESRDWRATLESAQHPFAVILGCADSRVPPELLFDQGFGDLFVVRVAGNIADTDVTASIEYGVDHLDIQLVLVLGHSQCGAVQAAVDHAAESPKEADEIVSLLYRIEPALADLPKDLDRKQKVALAVQRNVQLTVQRLSQTPDLMKSLKKGKLRVVGGIYDLHTGQVEFLDPEPKKNP